MIFVVYGSGEPYYTASEFGLVGVPPHIIRSKKPVCGRGALLAIHPVLYTIRIDSRGYRVQCTFSLTIFLQKVK
jgi:hypothetical protein